MIGAKEVHMTSVPILHSLQTAKNPSVFLTVARNELNVIPVWTY